MRLLLISHVLGVAVDQDGPRPWSAPVMREAVDAGIMINIDPGHPLAKDDDAGAELVLERVQTGEAWPGEMSMLPAAERSASTFCRQICSLSAGTLKALILVTPAPVPWSRIVLVQDHEFASKCCHRAPPLR